MRLDTRLFTLAKDPEQPGAFQDACCLDAEHHAAAIADGVSSALFSGPWAAILAEAAVADSPDPNNAEALRRLARPAAAALGGEHRYHQPRLAPEGQVAVGGLFDLALRPRLRARTRPGRARSAASASRPSPWATVASSRSAAANWYGPSRWRNPNSFRPIPSCWAAST